MKTFRAAALLLVPLLATPAWAGTNLTIAATGQVSVAPDEATATLNVRAQEDSAAKAQALVNKAVAQALAQAKSVPDVKVTTGGYSTYTITPDNNGPQQFVAQQSLSLVQPAAGGVPSDAFSSLLGTLQQDGLQLNSLSGDLSNAGQRQAQQAAIADALTQIQAQAGGIAAQLHQQVGTINSLDVNASTNIGPRPVMMMAMARDAPPAPQSAPDNVQVTANVTAKIELTP